MGTSGMGKQTKHTTNDADKDLLKLFECTIDIGKDVITAVVEERILPTYSGNFTTFLEDKKHDFFHWYDTKKIACCACPPQGYGILRKMKMDGWMFYKLYDSTGTNHTTHKIVRNGVVEQICLHRYTVRNIQLYKLDISMLFLIIKCFAKLSTHEQGALESVKTVRDKICHAWSTKSFNTTEIEDIWNTLQKAIIELTRPSYRNLIEKQIQKLRENELTHAKINDLTQEIKELLEELKNRPDNNNLLQEEITTSLIEQQEKIYQEQLRSNHMLKELLTLSKNLTHEINQMKLDVHIQRSSLINTRIPDGSIKDNDERWVMFKSEIPKGLNEEDIVATVKSKLKDVTFKVKYVGAGSLVIISSVPEKVLDDEDLFERSIKVFISNLVKVLNIDTTLPCHLSVKICIHDTAISEDKGNTKSTQTEIGRPELDKGHDDDITKYTQTEISSIVMEKELRWWDDVLERRKKPETKPMIYKMSVR